MKSMAFAVRKALACVALAAFAMLSSGCSIIFPAPSNSYTMKIQTLEDDSIGGQSRVHVYSGTVDAYFVAFMSDSVNTFGRRYARIQTGGDGMGYATDR